MTCYHGSVGVCIDPMGVDNVAVLVCIPAYNEAETITETVLTARALPHVTEVLVIDDGSTDATAALADKADATVISGKGNRGKGAAFELLARTLEQPLPSRPALCESDILLLLDADVGSSAKAAAALLEPVLLGQADMSVAVFPVSQQKAGFGLVVNTAREAIRRLGGGYNAQAPLSGQRAITWSCFRQLRPFADRYGVEVAMTIRALRCGFTVLEVPVEMHHRATGRDLAGFIHRGKQFLDVKKAIRDLGRSGR